MKKLALFIVLLGLAGALTAQTDPASSPAPIPGSSTPTADTPAPSAATSTTATPATAPAAATAAVSKIFAVNLWTGPVDVKFGQDGLFLTKGLAANAASQALVFSNYTPRSILFKPTAGETWMETKQDDGKVWNYAVQAGRTYLILVKANGNIGLYDITTPDSAKPKLVILNNTNKALSLGQIGTGVGAGTKLNFTGIATGAWSTLSDLPAGTWNAFWNYDGLTGPAQANATKFVEGGLYALILSHDIVKNMSNGAIWDLTPKK